MDRFCAAVSTSAILLSLVYYILTVSIHYFAPAEKKVFSQVGMSFALTSTTILVIDYVVQLSVIQPSLSMLCMAPAIVGNPKVEKAIRWLYVACFTLNAISFGLYAVFYGIHREYLFEIITISINWLTLITTGVLLSVMFRRALAALSDKRKVEVSPQAA